MRKYGGLILDAEQNQLRQQRCRSKYFHTVKGKKKNRKQKTLDPLEEWARDHPVMLLSDMDTLPASEELIFIHSRILEMRSEEGGGSGSRSTLEKRAKVNAAAEALPTDQKERGWGGGEGKQ